MVNSNVKDLVLQVLSICEQRPGVVGHVEMSEAELLAKRAENELRGRQTVLVRSDFYDITISRKNGTNGNSSYGAFVNISKWVMVDDAIEILQDNANWINSQLQEGDIAKYNMEKLTQKVKGAYFLDGEEVTPILVYGPIMFTYRRVINCETPIEMIVDRVREETGVCLDRIADSYTSGGISVEENGKITRHEIFSFFRCLPVAID